MNYSSEAQFEHHIGCEHCVFLGHVLDHDMYCCAGATIMLQYDNGMHDYHSGLDFGNEDYFNRTVNTASPEMLKRTMLYREALARAVGRGLVHHEKLLGFYDETKRDTTV